LGRAEELFEQIKNKGEDAINEFILTRKSEELFLDFKRSADNGNGKLLNTSDREKLAKAISGFGNSEGGVLVWGIDCSKDTDFADVAKAKFPIKNVKRFASWIENAISGCTLPPHKNVMTFTIESGKSGDGYVVNLIQKSDLAPHQCIYNYSYYLRSGSNFGHVPHAILAGLFGKRPQPKIINMYTFTPRRVDTHIAGEHSIHFELGLLMANQSSAIANNIFLHTKIFPPKGQNKVNVQITDTNFTAYMIFGGVLISVMSKNDFRLPPEGMVQPIVLGFALFPPFDEGLSFEQTWGCEGAPVENKIVNLSKDELNNICQRFIDQPEDKRDFGNLIQEIFKLPEIPKNKK
jgi:Putative DNA-binding domain